MTQMLLIDSAPAQQAAPAIGSTALVGRALVACEYSGVVRTALAAKGWDAWSCDMLETEQPGNHYAGDVRDMLSESWDLLIGHPPCTYLANSGVRWLHTDPSRWVKMYDAAELFCALLNAPVCHIAIENPVMHKYAKRLIGVEQSQTIQPWQYGHGETKATCLWLKSLPNLQPTNIVEGREQRIWKMPPGENRQKERSRTYEGVADAIADQWTDYYQQRPTAKLSLGTD